MKSKIFLSVFATIASLTMLSSCANDDLSPINDREGEVEVTMTTSLQGELTTYGTSSADGGLKNLAGKNYSVRYIMEVYPKGSDTHVVRMINYKPIESDPQSARSTTFETRLMAAEYNFVFYADIVKEINPSGGVPTDLTAPCYGNRYFWSNKSDDDAQHAVLIKTTEYGETAESGSLKSISANSNQYSQNENHGSLEQYDIYTCKESVDLRNENSHSFTLRRPFAKLRLVTTDEEDLDVDKVPDWNRTVVTMRSSDNNNQLNNTYNAVDGSFSNNGKGSYWEAYFQTTNAQGNEIYDNEASNGERTLGVIYVPVSNGSYNLNFQITTNKGNTKLIDNLPINVENVPLVANKLTTIKGKLLTKKFVSEIIIDDEFEDPETSIEFGKEAANQESLMSSLTGQSEKITYTGNVTKADGLTLDFTNLTRSEPIYEAGNTSVLTLNIGSIEEGAVITILGGANAPKEVVLNTGAKCSVRANLTNTRVTLGGSSYKNLVYNCAMFPTKPTFPIDAIFVVNNDRANIPRPSNNSDMHKFILSDDFKISQKTCNHENDSEISSWFENNTEKSAWDYVEEVK